MMHKEASAAKEKHTKSRQIAWAISLLALMLYTYWQLKRIELGHLFALSLPWDRDPTAAEIIDARLTAQAYLYPAMIAVLAIAGVIGFLSSRFHFSRSRLTGWEISAGGLFLFAVLADLLTTLHFFHQQGVVHELHPGIRLFGYAYGLTIGPLVGKLLQALGMILISLAAGRFGTLLLMVAATAYFLAAVYNAMQSMH